MAPCAACYTSSKGSLSYCYSPCPLRRSIPFEEQKVCVPVYHNGGFLSTVLHHSLQRLIDWLTHGNFPVAALGLRCFDVVAALRVPQKLVIHPDQAILKVKVRGQPTELRNTKPGSQQMISSSTYFRYTLSFCTKSIRLTSCSGVSTFFHLCCPLRLCLGQS